MPNVSNEEEAEINRVAEKAVWDPSSVTDPLSEGPRVIEEEILSRKGYMGMLKSCVGLAGHPGHAVCYYLGPAFFVIRPELKDLYRFGVFESL